MPAAAHGAAVDDAAGARIARQFSQTGVIALRLELGAQRGILLDRRGLLFIAFNPRYLCQRIY
jgi:hypothetical protein